MRGVLSTGEQPGGSCHHVWAAQGTARATGRRDKPSSGATQEPSTNHRRRKKGLAPGTRTHTEGHAPGPRRRGRAPWPAGSGEAERPARRAQGRGMRSACASRRLTRAGQDDVVAGGGHAACLVPQLPQVLAHRVGGALVPAVPSDRTRAAMDSCPQLPQAPAHRVGGALLPCRAPLWRRKAPQKARGCWQLGRMCTLQRVLLRAAGCCPGLIQPCLEPCTRLRPPASPAQASRPG